MTDDEAREKLARLELNACSPEPVRKSDFNNAAVLPSYGLSLDSLCEAMNDFLTYLRCANVALNAMGLARLERSMMPASFSGFVSEWVKTRIAELSCGALVVNAWPNGIPDLIPPGTYTSTVTKRHRQKQPNGEFKVVETTEEPKTMVNGAAYLDQGIEFKCSHIDGTWQGHNPFAGWLLGISYNSNKHPSADGGLPIPFRFELVACALLDGAHWNRFAQHQGSGRTHTSSINKTGMGVLRANWLYKAPSISGQQALWTAEQLGMDDNGESI